MGLSKEKIPQIHEPVSINVRSHEMFRPEAAPDISPGSPWHVAGGSPPALALALHAVEASPPAGRSATFTAGETAWMPKKGKPP